MIVRIEGNAPHTAASRRARPAPQVDLSPDEILAIRGSPAYLQTRLDQAHRRVWALEMAVVARLLVHNWGGDERRRCECQECIWLRSLISDGLYARMTTAAGADLGGGGL